MGKTPRRTPRRSAKPRASGVDDEVLRDEVDEFMASKDVVSFDKSEVAESEESADEEVFGLDGLDDDEDEDEEDGENRDVGLSDEEDRELLGLGKKEVSEHASTWGRKKKNYYNADIEAEEFQDDSEAEKEEAEEASRLQKEALKAVADDHLGDFANIKPQKRTKGAKLLQTDESSAKQLSKELDGIKLLDEITGNEESTEIEKDTSKLSREEKINIIKADAPEFEALLSELRSGIAEVRDNLEPTIRRLKEGEMKTGKGLDFLEAKLHIMLSYLSNLSFYLLMKAEGKSIKGHPVIEQLVEGRAVLEKMKVIEDKLKYQIEKYMKIAKGSQQGEDGDALSFKPKIGGEDEDEDEEDDEKEARESGIYRPPMQTAVSLEDDKSAARKLKEAERRKARMAKSSLMRDLREEFGEAPEEVRPFEDLQYTKFMNDEKEKLRYEEDTFTRLQTTKKDKSRRKALERGLNFENFDDLGDLDFGSFEKRADEGSDLQKRKSVMQQIGEMGQKNKKKRTERSGDEDLPIRSLEEKRNRVMQKKMEIRLKEQEAMGELDGQEDALYESVKSKKREIRAAKQPKIQMSEKDADMLDAESRRQTSKNIISNRGLTRARPKDMKNPRKAHRQRFEKKMTVYRTTRRKAHGSASGYGGEFTGVRKNLSRSVKLS